MTGGLTSLEKAVLDMMIEKPGQHFETIRQQMAHAQVGRREFSGVGFFTYFIVTSDAPVRRDLPDMELGGVTAELRGGQYLAGFTLFVRAGVINMLEGYTFDQPWPKTTDDFEVKEWPLSSGEA